MRYGDENQVIEDTVGDFERSIEDINTRSSIAIENSNHDKFFDDATLEAQKQKTKDVLKKKSCFLNRFKVSQRSQKALENVGLD